MYTYIWKKYLPLIRLLLKKASQAPQTAGLNQTDFLKFSKSRKPTLNFSIDVHEGRYSVLKLPTIASELLEILREDPAARALIQAGHFNLSMSRNYELSIRDLSAEQEPVPEPAEN